MLLSVPRDVLLERIASRTTSSFDRAAGERERILADLNAVQPRLRATATVELDTTAPVQAGVDAIDALATEPTTTP